MISRQLQFIRDLILTGPDGEKTKILSARGAEQGLDHVEIVTQSKDQKELGSKSILRVYAEEVDE